MHGEILGMQIKYLATDALQGTDDDTPCGCHDAGAADRVSQRDDGRGGDEVIVALIAASVLAHNLHRHSSTLQHAA